MKHKRGINIDKFQEEITKKYYNFHKNLLKDQYFNSSNVPQLQTISALEGFVTYLRYLRDSMFLQELGYENYNTNEFKGSVALNLLTVAISEYEKSQTCISNYFDIDFTKLNDKDLENIITPKETSEGEDNFSAMQDKYIKEWQQHWSKFWELAAKCIDLSLYSNNIK